MRGIHGAHFGPGVFIRYASTDSSRQTIPWVEYRNSSMNEIRTDAVGDSEVRRRGKLLNYSMQCVDCHNRPTHTFELPERAVNRSMALGRIPVSLRFIRKKAVEALRARYATSEEAAQKIPAAIRELLPPGASRDTINPVPKMSRLRPMPFSRSITTTSFPI